MQKRDELAQLQGDADGATAGQRDREPVVDTLGAAATGEETIVTEPRADQDMSVETPARAREAGPPPAPPVVSGRSAWILVVCCVAQFMVILDLSIVNVALPSIQDSLNFSSNDLQWVVDAYAITFAGFLITSGNGVCSRRRWSCSQ
jgi:hypothetical protein